MSYERATYLATKSLLAHIENVTYLFPESTLDYVLFATAAGVNTWTNWVEIVGFVGGMTFSSRFAATPGYLTDIMVYLHAPANVIYEMEVGWGVAYTVVGRVRMYADWTYHLPMWSAQIPAGQVVYYRMRCENSPASMRGAFRYHYVIP